MSRTDLRALHAGRSANVATRARWINLLANGLVTVQDALDAACTPDGKALRALTLRRLLTSGAGQSRTKAEKTLGRIDQMLETSTDRRKMTIGWLLDPNSRGRRYQAWLETQHSKNTPPWCGFPYSASPVNH